MFKVSISSMDEKVEIIQHLSDLPNKKTYPDNLLGDKNKVRVFTRKAQLFQLSDNGNNLRYKVKEKTRAKWAEYDNCNIDQITKTLEYFCEFEKDQKLERIMFYHLNNGHLRQNNLLQFCRRHIYGVNVENVNSVIKTCKGCCTSNSIQTKKPMKPIITTRLRERYQADLVDLRAYSSQNQSYSWILNILDCYSKYLMSYPLKSKSALEVSNAFKKCFLTFGPPQLLKTDNGKEFTNNEMSRLTDSFNILLIHGRPRHPQSQGQIERCNQTVKRLLKKFIFNNEKIVFNWINYHDDVVGSYNRTMVHRANNKTPFMIFFGCSGNNAYVEGAHDISFQELPESDKSINKYTTFNFQEESEQENILKPKTKLEIDNTRKIYTMKYVEKSRWSQNEIFPLAVGDTVLLKIDYDGNKETKKSALSPEFGSNIYEIVDIDVDKFGVSLCELENAKNVIRGVSLSRIQKFNP